MDVEALLVVAVRPGDDMGGAQQRRIGDAGQRAPAIPVIHQGGAEHVLADALDHPALGLGGAGKICGLGLEAVERRLGQAHRQLVDAIQRGMQLLDRGEHEGRDARAGNGGDAGDVPISAATPE